MASVTVAVSFSGWRASMIESAALARSTSIDGG
jgi:hypothetical protein